MTRPLALTEAATRTLRVLYVAPEDSIDGSNTSLRDLLVTLKTVSIIEECVLVPSVHIQKFYAERGLNAEILAFIYPLVHVELIGWGHGFLGGALRQIKSFLRHGRIAGPFAAALERHRPDIVHLNEVTLLWHAMLAKRRGYPVVMHDRAAIAKGGFGIRRRILCELLNRYVDALIAICPSYVKRLGIAGHKTHVVLNPFQSVGSAAAVPEKLTMSCVPTHGRIRLLLVGARQEKGLLEAMRAVDLMVDAYLTVAGRTHATFVRRSWSVEDATWNAYERRVARWIEQNPETARRIHFLGEVPRITEAMRESDVVLIPWMMPHFSRPMFEAWLVRRPVVVFDTEGVQEFCQDHINALVVPRGDWRAMASAVERLKTDTALRKRLVENGYLRVRSLIDNEGCARAILRVYEQVAVAS